MTNIYINATTVYCPLDGASCCLSPTHIHKYDALKGISMGNKIES